jgi:hypothetical protein
MFASLLMKCLVSHEYGRIIFGAELPFSATGSGRRTTCELKTLLAIYIYICRSNRKTTDSNEGNAADLKMKAVERVS